MTSAIARFTRFDVASIALTQPLRVVLPLALVVVFSITLPVPGVGIVVGAVVAAVSASIPFQGDERGRLDMLYGIAPIDRTAVVVGRYVSMLAFAVVAIGLGVATTFVVGALRHQDVGGPLLGVMLLAAFVCVCVTYSVQLPWFFALGYTRGRPMVYIPVGIIAVVGFIAGQSGWLSQSRTPDILAPSAGIAVAVVVGGLLVLIASAVIAVRVYRRRDL